VWCSVWIIHLCLPAFLLAGHAAAQQLFGSVQDVVSALPQLSLLNQQLHTQLRNVSLFSCLQEPNFSGTLFAPLNVVSHEYMEYQRETLGTRPQQPDSQEVCADLLLQGLKPLYDAGGLSAALGDREHVADIFSTAVVPGEGMPLDKLQHGMRLSTLNGHSIVISVRK
jgi:hypothetical protein